MKRTLTSCLAAIMISGALSVDVLADDPVFAEPTVPAEWASLDEEGLGYTAGQLEKAGAAEAANRVLLADYVGWKYLNDAAATRSLKLYTWSVLTRSLAADVSTEKKALWVSRLRAAYVADAEVLTAVTPGDIRNLTAALEKMGDAATQVLLVQWGQTTTALGSGNSNSLYWLSRSLSLTGAAGAAARTRLAEHLTSEYVKDNESARKIPVNLWDLQAGYLKAELSDSQKTAWAGRLRSAFAGDATAMAALSYADAESLKKALRTLGDTSWQALMRDWSQSSDSWRSLDVGQLQWLASSLPQGEDGQAQRQAIATHVSETCIADLEKVRQMGIDGWSRLVGALKGDLTETQKNLWAARLQAAFAVDATAVSSLDQNSLRNLTSILKTLGIADVSALLAAWSSASGTVDTLTESNLGWLLVRLSELGEAGHEQRAALVGNIETKYLASAEAAQALKLESWGAAVRHLACDMTANSKTLWIQKLRGAFAADAQMQAKLDTTQFIQLVGIVRGLGDTAIPALTASWMTSSVSWQSADTYTLQLLSGYLGKEPNAVAGRQVLAGHLSNSLMNDAAKIREAGLDRCAILVTNLNGDLSETARGQWAAKLREAFASDAATTAGLDQKTFRTLVTALKALGVDDVSTLMMAWTGSADTLTAENLGWLLARLSELGDGGHEQRAALIRSIEAKYFANPEAARALKLESWNAAVRQLVGDMPAASKTLWVQKLRGAFAADAQVLAQLDTTQFIQLASMMRLLDDTAIPATTSSWMTSSGSWQSADSYTLQSLSGYLGKEPDAAAGRQALAGHLSNSLMNDAAKIREAGLGQCAILVTNLSGDLSETVRVQWAAKLREAFAGDAGAIAGLDQKTFRTLITALATLGVDDVSMLLATWTDNAGSLTAENLGWLLAQLSGLGDGGSDKRVVLAQKMESQYLEDPAAARELGIDQWMRSVQLLVDDLAADVRARWATKLRAAFAGNVQTLTTMDTGQFKTLAITLGLLGDDQMPLLVSQWVIDGTTWRSVCPSDFVWYAVALSKAEAAGHPARLRLAEHLKDKYTANEAAVQEVSWADWAQLSRILAADLDESFKTLWAGRLRDHGLSSGQLSQLSLEQMWDANRCLSKLGDEEVPSLLLAWAKTNTSWQTASPLQIAWFARDLPSFSEDADRMRQTMAEHLERDYLDDPSSAREVGIARWQVLAGYLKAGLSREARASWGDKLTAAYTADIETLSSLSQEEADMLIKTMTVLECNEEVETILKRLESRANPLSLSPGEAAKLLVSVLRGARGNRARVLGLFKTYKPMLDQAELSECSSWQDAVATAQVWCWLEGNSGKARNWATHAYQLRLGTEELRQSVDRGALNGISSIFREMQVADEFTGTYEPAGYCGFAEAVARLAAQGELDNEGWTWQLHRQWATMLDSPEARDVVRAALVDPQGQVRLPVARTLAWAYRRALQMKEWKAFLDLQIESTVGDAKARWLLARADAEAMKSARYFAMGGKSSLVAAFDAAASEACRMEVLDVLAMAYASMSKHDKALSLIESVRAQFSDEGQILQLDQLVDRVEASKAKAAQTRLRYIKHVAERRARFEAYRQ